MSGQIMFSSHSAGDWTWKRSADVRCSPLLSDLSSPSVFGFEISVFFLLLLLLLLFSVFGTDAKCIQRAVFFVFVLL